MKKFVAPLQASAALFVCVGMGWMVFVLASINPAPPTAGDLQARSTQDLSFANMNNTAVALAKQMLADVVPSPAILLMPVTGQGTATPTPGAAITLKAVETFLETYTPSSPHWITATPTRKVQERPSATRTPAPTSTPRPPTATATKTSMPTSTPVTPSKTATPLPTNTPKPTKTPVSPTATEPPPQPTATEPPPQPTSTDPPPPTATEPPPTSPPPTSEPPTNPPPPTDPPSPSDTPAPVIQTPEPPTQPTP